MKILILEDDENRIKKFKMNFIGCELFITHLPKQANKWLEENEFDVIFLDCDLAPEHYNSADWITKDGSEFDDTSGVCVGKFLYENPHINSNAEIIIHSLNPVGSSRIYDYCHNRKCSKIPYWSLWDRLIINRP